MRDPRDVYASYKARDEKNNRPVTAIDAFAFAWGRSVLQLKENLGDVGESNYLVIKYEDVVSNPDKMMASILAFLDLDPHEITATPTKGHGRVPWGGNPESGKKEFKVYSSASGKWKSRLSQQEVSAIENLLHHEMAIAGYERSGAKLRWYPMMRVKINCGRLNISFDIEGCRCRKNSSCRRWSAKPVGHGLMTEPPQLPSRCNLMDLTVATYQHCHPLVQSRPNFWKKRFTAIINEERNTPTWSI